jgi:IMP dehydrogenase
MASGFDALAEIVRGATFDDFLLRPQYSVITRRDPSVIDLSCRFSTHITLKRPLVSANMDTVTRAPMAIVQAEEGGIGIIDRGFRNGDIEPQVHEVAKVKRMQHIIIRDPYSVTPETPLGDAVALMRRRRAGTLVVIDAARTLKGLLTERDVRFVDTREGTVSSRMTPVEALITGQGELTLKVAEDLMVQRKVKKLPLVDKNGTLIGLITAKDIHRQERLPFATRDAHGRLMVGAAIGATGDFIERAAEFLKAHRRCHRHRHRARPFDRDGQGDRHVQAIIPRCRARRRQRRDRGRRRSSRNAVSTGSRSASVSAAAATTRLTTSFGAATAGVV